MPTYEYSCKDCGEQLEVVQSFTDDALTVCPSCGGELKKVFGNIGIVFKGSGFYKTDSRSSSSSVKAAASTDAPSGSNGDGASTTSTDKADKAEKSSSSSDAKDKRASTTSSDAKTSAKPKDKKPSKAAS